MEIINFEEVKGRKKPKVRRPSKSRKQPKEKITEHLPETDDRISELQRHYQELAQFYNQWYADHVIGQDKDGRWIYKDL